MHRDIIVSLSLVLAVSCSSVAAAQVTHINFDTAPGGDPISGGTVVNTLYTSQGVTFRSIASANCGSCLDGNAYASSQCVFSSAISQPNVVTLFGGQTCADISEFWFGVVQAEFGSAVDSACVLVLPDGPGDFAVLHAFNSAGIEIAAAFSSPGATQDLCVASPGIRKVTFSGSDTKYAEFDNLAFRTEHPTPTLRQTWGGLKSLYR